MEKKIPKWLVWARELQALAQTGLHYSETEYHVERYRRLQEIAAEIVTEYGQLPDAVALESFRIQPGYATPKVDVRGAVIRDGKILLVKERRDGAWCLPGGWADVGESAAEMVIREVREESGYHVVPTKIVGVYDCNRSGIPLEFYHAYKIVFLCDLKGGHAQTSSETEAVDFFTPDEIPRLSGERTSKRHLADVWTHHDQIGLKTVFD